MVCIFRNLNKGFAFKSPEVYKLGQTPEEELSVQGKSCNSVIVQTRKGVGFAWLDKVDIKIIKIIII